MNEDDPVLRGRLRGLTADAARTAVPRAPEAVRARGIRRRNRLRAAGASVAAVAVITATAWVVRPDASTPSVGTPDAASPSATGEHVPPVGPVLLPAAPAMPTTSATPATPTASAVTWGPGTPFTTDSGAAPSDLTDLLYYTCPGSDAIVLPTGTAFRYTSAHGSEVRQWWTDTSIPGRPEEGDAAAVEAVHEISEFANGCLYRVSDEETDMWPLSAVWRWGGGDTRGRLLISRQGSHVVVQITRMVAPEPDIEVAAASGAELLDRVWPSKSTPGSGG